MGLFDDALKPKGLFPEAAEKPPEIDLTAPVGSEGVTGGLADAGRALAHGTIVGVPKQIGQTAQNFGRELGSQGLADWGKETVESADARDKAHPELKQSIVGQVAAQDPFSVRGGAYGAGDNTPMSLGPGLAGAATGAAIGSVVPGVGTLAGAAAGYIGGSILALPFFYGSQGQESYEKIKAERLKANPTDLEGAEQAATTGSRISGGIEAGGELLADAIPFHQLLSPLAKPIKGMALKSLFDGGLRKLAANVGAQEVAEVSTEMGQQAGEAAVEGHYGGGEGATWKDTLSVVMPTALMTLVPGLAIGAHNLRTAAQAKAALTNADADPAARVDAAKMAVVGLSHVDPDVAKGFDVYAKEQIRKAEPIDLDHQDGFFKALAEFQPPPPPEAAPSGQEAPAADSAAPTAEGEQPLTEFNSEPPPPPAGPLEQAAAIAAGTGATAGADAARQGEVDQAKAAADAEAKAKETGEDVVEPPAPPPTNPVTGALIPFDSAEAAHGVAAQLTEQTGREHEAFPHPTIHDKFAVRERTGETHEPAASSEEAPSPERSGQDEPGDTADAAPADGPGESPGSAAEASDERR
jgi:hypothetical protein